jgi:transcriptional regulator with XRE-family HTH domain
VEDDSVAPALMAPEYASTGLEFGAGQDASGLDVGDEPGTNDDDGDAPDAAADMLFGMALAAMARGTPDPRARDIERRLGLALLRLRVYRGWSQTKLEQVSGVDQSIISRLETAKSRGTSIRCLFAILSSLRAEEITFGPGPRTVPQSSWEDAMYGDLWERAGRIAEARLSRRRSA